jgi:hypothetical protein
MICAIPSAGMIRENRMACERSGLLPDGIVGPHLLYPNFFQPESSRTASAETVSFRGEITTSAGS